MFGRTFSLQPNFFGIKKYSNDELEKFNAKNKTILTNMKEAKMVLLQFRGERDESWTDEQIKAYEIAISEYFINDYKNPHLKVLVVSNSFAQKEIQRGGLKLQPFLAVGFVIMVVFTVFTELIIGAAFGMLFFAGFRFGPIILVTPFLILAIGVDDSFLMMHAWQRIVSKLRKHPRSDDSIEYRIAEVLAEAGPSITISALTNIMAFIVGALTSPPEVELFCYANAFALFVDTVFSVTLYAAIMAICGKQEMKTENQTSNSSLKLQKHLQKAKNVCYNFLDFYINLLTKVSVSIFIIILLFGYLALTTYGLLNLGIDLSSHKFFLKDSILLEADNYRLKYVIPYFTPAAIIVNNPGNLSDPQRIKNLNNFIHSFETMNNSIGSDATKYFLRDYEEYKDPFGDLPPGIKPFNAADLDDFLSWPEYSFWKGFLKLKTEKNGSKILDKFFVNVGFEGKELVSWEERGRLLKAWRDEVDKYQDTFNATIYSDDALFLDLIKVIPSVSWQSAAATLVCMTIACFLFMFDPFTVIVASLSICSICLGIFGFLHFWSISQDPVMMAATVMSIGFSVDIPAHIAFHYYRTGVTSSSIDPSVKARLKHTLAAVGFPVIQAGVSTCLCVLSLLMVPMYMSEVFVKTMFLCIILGLIHGLFIMPAIFNLYQKIRTNCFSKNRRQEKDVKNVALKGVNFFGDFDNPKMTNALAPA
uniref:SSD domain-containing protein n=1 Tax=Panagrolaimus davidi TaxID=227884 RepID=A0A914QF44_9BILA